MLSLISKITKKCWTRCADDTKRLGSMASMMGVELERVPSADGASGVTEEVKSSS